MPHRYVLVLARTPQDASIYAKRAGLDRANYRAVSGAKSIKGIKVADVHMLPDFAQRPDRHAILAELRWGRDIAYFDVEMPPPPVVDQGDGFGEQLTLEDARDHLESVFQPARRHKSVDPVVEIVSAVREEGGKAIAAAFDKEFPQPAADSLDHVVPDDTAAERAEDKPARKRRSRCKDCGRLTFTSYADDPEGHGIEAHEAPAKSEFF